MSARPSWFKRFHLIGNCSNATWLSRTRPARRAQAQHLDEQPGEDLEVALAELVDGAEVGSGARPVTAMTSTRSSHALAIRRDE